jgi:hypothetical protein
MKDRFCILDVTKRDEFEKEYQLPYGYASSLITFSFDEALDIVKNFDSNGVLIIEKVNSEGREEVYRK